MSVVENIVILGSGPAGLTAAIYAARANLKPLLVEGIQPGGQLTITTEVENFPGFALGIQGPDLMIEMKKQAERFGTRFLQGNVDRVDLSSRPFTVFTDEETIKTRALIIAMGASAKLLNLPSEKRLMGHGVSACATCDGFFFKDKKVLVVGGGDTAMEEAHFLTRFANEVKIIHRRDAFRASKIMQERVMKNPKISFIWNSEVIRVLGEESGKVEAVALKNFKTGAVTEEKCDGLFIAIGHEPNSAPFRGQLKMNESGYILTGPGTKTSVPGVFAAGDIQDFTYKQAVTAAGTGCMAAIDAERYLEEGP
ncbi:MAG TPA: thioredoxin-disulfide reductase [Nitrospiria bacterium]|nr:thioredoxin-disulfide reductase [Nitrospiria bacterium]